MPVPGRSRYVVCLVLAGLVTLSGLGCLGARRNFVDVKTPVKEAGLVFVIDGAGNFQACSQHIRKVVTQDCLALQIATVVWSHGYGRFVADQIGYAHARARGCKFAGVLQQVRQENPSVPIYLVAHSAGAAVAVAALENLPPCAVDRVIFLAPSLSAAYDLRPALQAVRRGLHVFHSQRDNIYLGVWTGILGNSDRRWGPSSGRIGFQVNAACPDDVLLRKLYQRPWQPADRDVGNDGKHFGSYQPDFVRAHVLPLLLN